MEVLSNTKSGPKKNLLWTQEMDKYLVDILYEHTIYRRQKDRSFTSTAYANASRAMSKKFGENISKEHIKDRLKTIMQIFNLAYDLVLEADPQVWQELIAIS